MAQPIAAKRSFRRYDSMDQLPEHAVLLTHADGKIPMPNAQRVGIAALQVGESRALLVATAEGGRSPFRTELEVRLRKSSYEIKLGLTTLGVIRSLYESFGSSKDRSTAAAGEISDDAGLKAEFNHLIEQAVSLDASDIHIERRPRGAVVKMRRHGELVKVVSDWSSRHAEDMCRSIYNSVADSGSKSLSFDPRGFQQAAINTDVNHVAYRIRYQAAPVFPEGSDTVLRVLPTGRNMKAVPLEHLGYHPWHAKALRAMLTRASGIIFVSGTTGSGKTTTINNLMLLRLKDNPGKKALSIEDPPEYVMPGVSQIPVPRLDGKEGNPFIGAMRAVMRMDPDLIMVGEVRDIESARLVVSMVQSGHQVMSTIHTPSARSVPARLYDMGVERSVLASDDFFAGLIYQKLLPLLCSKCALPLQRALQASAIDSELLDRLRALDGLAESDLDAMRVRGGGCAHCNGYGIVGRTVCAELIVPDFEMLRYFRTADDVALYRYWRSRKGDGEESLEGWTAFDHAVLKMKKGIVSPESVEGAFGYLTLQQERQDMSEQALAPVREVFKHECAS